MLQDIECALLMPAQGAAWVQAWACAQARVAKRSRFVPLVCGVASSGSAPSPMALEAMRADLFRYQLCVLPVDSGNLAWARTALASLAGPLPAPLICLCHQLRAEAIGDLLMLGAEDFILLGGGTEEVRARCSWRIKAFQRASRNRYAHDPATASALAEPAHAYTNEIVAGDRAEASLAANRTGASAATACASFSDVSFSRAKKIVVDRFECAYLRNALMRHAGNVAGAARASDKHRRAFWALMRKHGINADTYRQGRRVRR